MPRIVIIGASGSGKTTLARKLAQRLGIAHAELDELHWGPDWTARPDFRQRVRDFVRSDDWVLDGGYSDVRDIVWGRADTIVWLDYPMRLVFTRVLRRTIARWWNRDVLWSGNRERMWGQLTQPDSILLWVINTWRLRRRDYPRLLRSAEFAHATRVRLRSPRAAERWLDSFTAGVYSRA